MEQRLSELQGVDFQMEEVRHVHEAIGDSELGKYFRAPVAS